MHAQPAAAREAAGEARPSPQASAWCASASASTATPAPATIPASAISGCPSLTHQAQPRPAAQRPGGHRARQLRRLRHVRRGLACRRAVPFVLPRRRRQQPECAGTACAPRCGSGVIGALQRRIERRLARHGLLMATSAAADQDRHPGHGRRGRRRARRLDRRLGEANGHIAQSTSVPGVAQRTGATIYYIELFPRAAAEAEGAAPVLALIPTAGRRGRGHRLRADGSRPRSAARPGDAGPHHADRLDAPRLRHRREVGHGRRRGRQRGRWRPPASQPRSASSASTWPRPASAAAASSARCCSVRCAASGALPFAREAFEATIARGGVGVDASLRAFDEGARQARRTRRRPCRTAAPKLPAPPPTHACPPGRQRAAGAPARRLSPSRARPWLTEGVRRLIDYQDPAYAGAVPGPHGAASLRPATTS